MAAYATASVAGTFVYTPATGTVLSAGAAQTLSTTFTPTDAANYTTATATVTLNVTKATPTITWPAPAAIGYGTALSATQLNATASFGATSVPGTFVYTPAAGAVLSAGVGQTLAVTFTPSDTTNYATATASVTIDVAKATPTATLTVSNSPQAYDGVAHAATVGVTTSSVAGAVTNVRTGGAATQTTAGTYAVTADFVPTDTTNYTTLTGLSAGNFVITKATPTATLTVTNSPQTYTGTGLAATVTLTSSVPGAVTNVRTGGAATQTTAGTYAVTADFVPTDTTNYTTLTGLSAGNFVITKATPTATLAVSNSPQTYTGAGLAATVTLTSSVAGTVTNVRTGGAATQTTTGTYAVTADFVPTDTTNYTSLIDVAAGNFVITKATPTATLTVSNSPQAYTGIGLAATITLTSSVPGAVTNVRTGGAATQTTAGTYAVTADFVPTDTANYTTLIDLSAGSFVITKATPTATLTVSNSPQTYTGAGLAATVTLTSSVPGAVTNVRTGGAATQTTAGTYAVTADFVPTDTANYTSLIDVAAGNFVITKATPTATLTVSNSPQPYTGIGLAATVTLTSSVPGTVTNVRTGGAATQTTAGTYAVTSDFVPTDTTNYTSVIALAAGNFVITKATPTATLTVSNSPQAYTGAGLAAAVTLTSSVPGTVTNILTGGAATKTAAGTYVVTADFVPTDTANYTTLIDLAVGNFVITKATPTATLTVSNSPQTYTGAGLAATVTLTSSVPGAVTNVRTGGAATQTTAGTYAVTADFVPTDTTNYTSLIDVAAGNFVITKATPTATLTVSNSPQTYTGAGLAAIVTLTSSVPGAVTNVRTRRAARATAGTLCGDGGLCADRHDQLHLLARPVGRFLDDQQGDADGDAGGEQLARDLHGRRPGRDGHADELRPWRGDERTDGRRGDADDGGHLCGPRGLRPNRHDQLRDADGSLGGQLCDRESDADGDADGEQFAAGVHGHRPGGHRHAHELGPRRGDERADRRRSDADDRGDLCGERGLRADRHDELHVGDRRRGRELRDQQGDADGDAGGEQLATDLHGRRPGRDDHADGLRPWRGDERADRRCGDADDRGHLCGPRGLRADRHDQLHLGDRCRGRELRDHQGDADGDADGEQFPADVHGRRARGDGHADQLGAGRGDERADRRRGDADDGRDLCSPRGLRADRHDELHLGDRRCGRELRDHQGDADGDAGGEQLAADVNGRRPGGDRHAHELGPGAVTIVRTGGAATQTTRGPNAVTGGLRADRHDQLHLVDRPRGRAIS